jgi:hypothetical protein
MHVYEVRPRTDKRGVDPISDVLPFGRLCYGASGAKTEIGETNFRRIVIRRRHLLDHAKGK